MLDKRICPQDFSLSIASLGVQDFLDPEDSIYSESMPDKYVTEYLIVLGKNVNLFYQVEILHRKCHFLQKRVSDVPSLLCCQHLLLPIRESYPQDENRFFENVH